MSTQDPRRLTREQISILYSNVAGIAVAKFNEKGEIPPALMLATFEPTEILMVEIPMQMLLGLYEVAPENAVEQQHNILQRFLAGIFDTASALRASFAVPPDAVVMVAPGGPRAGDEIPAIEFVSVQVITHHNGTWHGRNPIVDGKATLNELCEPLTVAVAAAASPTTH
ncbi:hypothetical protein [Pararobbsia silviterrae]|uniref:Uncharacterized protein n=1 Tax=Pararobbsia silviterrae TaxID=1792498 RepID=A0A494X4Q6_9BURK|nr:hypothetical protein [Pararobbsia silviterrae]RKP44661.1 hypothetical protein D7S86_26895 [Pararobbsia silviterrae]